HRGPVRLCGNYQKTKRARSCPPLPQDVANIFITNIAPGPPKMNLRRLPRNRIILSNSFRSKPLFAIFTPSSLSGRKTQSRIFPTTTDNIHTFKRLGENSTITQTAVNCDYHLPLSFSQSVKIVPQPLDGLKSPVREVMYLDR